MRQLVIGVVLTGMCFFAGMSDVGATPFDDRKVVINIPSRTLWLYEDDKIVRYYPVGVGRPGFMTPIGQYKVMRKILNPAWENPYKPSGKAYIRPGKGNPLGTRWIGFKPYKGGEYGIHGTDNPASIGKFSSHGCVRMKVKDAEDLFNRVQLGTPLEVRYDLVLIRQKGQEVTVSVYPDTFGKGKPKLEGVKQNILKQHPTAQINAPGLMSALKGSLQKPVVIGLIQPQPAEQTVSHPDPLPPLPPLPLTPNPEKSVHDERE